MLFGFLTRIGLSRGAAIALSVAALLALAGLGAWGTFSTISSMVADAATAAKVERDAHWRAEIATANATAERARADQAVAAMTADAEIRAAQSRFQTELKELEEKNAALAGGNVVGLGRDRVRLLNGAR